MSWLKNLQLRSAVTRGALNRVSDLVSAGADVEATNPQGLSVLMLAAAYGQSDVVHLLVELGADINRSAVVTWAGRRIGGVTPLMAACCDSTGRADVVELLLDLGANAAARDSEGRTAFDYAELSSYQAIVALLRERSASA